MATPKKRVEKHKGKYLAQETKDCYFCCIGKRAWNSKVGKREEILEWHKAKCLFLLEAAHSPFLSPSPIDSLDDLLRTVANLILPNF